MSLLIARSPVFDHQDRIFAYALAVHAPSGELGDHDEIKIEQLFAEIFLDREADTISDGQRVFLSVGRRMILSGVVPMLPADRVILQVPLPWTPDVELETAYRDLVSAGYRLAIAITDAPVASSILGLAHVVGVDVRNPEAARIAALVNGRTPHALASGVRHRVERDHWRTLGFDLFEGYRVSSPESLSLRTVEHTRMVMLEALRLARDPIANDREIEELIRSDAHLSQKLLRMMNSAPGRDHAVLSIGHGLRLFDREQVSRWLGVLLATSEDGVGAQGELMHLALLRARMCERVADLAGVTEARSSLFLIGLMSVLDQLLELPMVALCDTMDFTPELRDALLSRTGLSGTLLRLVDAYASGEWRDVAELCHALGVTTEALRPAYLEAMTWASSQRRIV